MTQRSHSRRHWCSVTYRRGAPQAVTFRYPQQYAESPVLKALTQDRRI